MKQVFFDSTYWVLSNFSKHLNLCRKKHKPAGLVKLEKVDVKIDYGEVLISSPNLDKEACSEKGNDAFDIIPLELVPEESKVNET